MFKKRVSVLIAFLTIALLGFEAFSSEYRVGAGDVITVNVFKEADFSGNFRIDSKGNLNYPPVGDIFVDGKNVDEIRSLLSEILGKDYLVSPKVSVSVKEYNAKKVMVVGAVAKPGVYPLKEQSKVLDVISMAGGISKDGSRRIIVLRKEVTPQPAKKEKEAPQSSPSEEGSSVKDSAKDKKAKDNAHVDLSDDISPELSGIEPVSEIPDAHNLKVDGGKGKNDVPTMDAADLQDAVKEAVKEDSSSAEKVKGSSKSAGEIDQKTQGESKKEDIKKAGETDSGAAKQGDNVNESRKPIVINFEKILSGKDITQNIEIVSGDVINVPKADEVFVYGSVKNPGPVKYEDSMGVLQAVTLAGGPTPEASQGSTYILRIEDNGKEKRIQVNLSKVLKQKKKNISVKPNDVVVVPESFF